MDAKTYQEAIEYEKLTQAVYQSILAKEGQNIDVEHNVVKVGRSSVGHQVDVFWRFSQATVEHTVLIECKNYASELTLEKVRNFFAVLHDIGNCRGIMVTKTGYQSGVQDFARYYGIGLKLLRQPTADDWEGRIKDVHVHISARGVVSSDEHPIRIDVVFGAADEFQQARLEALVAGQRLNPTSGPGMRLLDKDGNPKTEEMRYWLPRNLNVLDKEDGGPYEQRFPLQDCYLYVDEGGAAQELVPLVGLVVAYYVETIDTTTLELHGEQIVEAVLKDQFSGTVEHVKRRDG